MDLPEAIQAQLFEFKVDEDGARPKKVNPLTRGMALRYFIALMEGFTARFGGKLHLYNENNSESANLGVEQDEFILNLLGVEVLRLGAKKAQMPPTRFGTRGNSYVELCDETGKVWQIRVTNGQLQLRDGKSKG